MPRTQIATPDLTALFSGGVAPPAFELRENRCETIDMADDRAPYVQSSGVATLSFAANFAFDGRPVSWPKYLVGLAVAAIIGGLVSGLVGGAVLAWWFKPHEHDG